MAKKQKNDATDRFKEVLFAKPNVESEKDRIKREKREAKEAKKRERIAAKREKADLKGTRTMLSPTAIVVIITAAVAFVVVAALAVYFIVDRHKRDPKFDYLESDLTKYVEFSKPYDNFAVNIVLAKPHEKREDGSGVSDLEAEILYLLAKGREVVGDGAANTAATTVGVGDDANIWFRGYLKHPETGEQVIVSGLTNFSNTKATAVSIGLGTFFARGLEAALVNVNLADYAKFEKISSGTVDKDQHVAYVSFTRDIKSDTATDKVTGSSVRIDLSDVETVKESFGEGFIEAIHGKTIGKDYKSSFETTMNNKTYTYTNVTVDFVTTCEKESTNGGKPVLVVETYIPYTSSTTYLRNETVYFEVYVESVVDYIADEWNDAFIEELVSASDAEITREELVTKYEGEKLTDKYEKYLEASLDALYEDERKELIEEEVWNYYLKYAKVLRYPGEKVDAIYAEYEADVRRQFRDSEGTLWNEVDEKYDEFATLDEFAVAYLGLADGEDWKATLRTMSENLVKERLILYYIMTEKNLTPTEEALAAEVASLKDEYLEEYISQYLAQVQKTREDYNDTEWAEFVASRTEELFDYYDDDYFTETAYYEIVIETIITWPTVSDVEAGSYPYEVTK